MNGTIDSSPFQSSPLDQATSPRLFWQNRGGFNSENLYAGSPGSTSPTRRSSIERLQKASRVKNSSILAQEQKNEYDPTNVPRVERPLSKVQSNSFGALGIVGMREGPPTRGHQRSESKTNIPLYSPTKTSTSSASVDSQAQAQRDLASSVQSDPNADIPASATSAAPVIASKDQSSPIKSSLSSRFKSSYDDHGDFALDGSVVGSYELPDGRILHRHGKSVTFDAAPPQVNEYEMATPDLSSVGSNSREGSFESEEDEDDYNYHFSAGDRDQDDSFDASLEDTDKTPVVGPEDWRHDSPDSRRDHGFDGSPMPDTTPSSAVGHQDVKGPSGSSGDHRPLPPLPGMDHVRNDSTSSQGLSTTAERMLGGSPRSLPPPPAATSKSEIQNIGNNKMSLEERLRLMMLSDDGKSAAELQRERRMRRAGAKDRANSQTPEPDTAAQLGIDDEHGEGEDTIGDLSGLEEYRLPPRISRESILRRVNGTVGNERESDYNFSSPAPSSSPTRRLPLDPDVPIPSTEHDDDNSIFVDNSADEKRYTGYDIPDMYADHGEDDIDDGESNYSDDQATDKMHHSDMDGATTPRANTPVQESSSSHTVQDDDIRRSELPTSPQEGRISLGESHPFAMEAASEVAAADDHMLTRDEEAGLERPLTPEMEIRPKHMSKPEYDGSGWGDDEEYEEPGTPDSVIHHPVQDDDVYEDEEEGDEYFEVRDSPAIPEQLATIKASGSKLKTRASATPSDVMAMREARRQVSREIPDVPPIPDRHRNRLSRDMGGEDPFTVSGDDFLERHPSFKKRSLTLDLDLGLSLDQDFERVIEAQKVITTHVPYSFSSIAVFSAAGMPPRQASRHTAEDDKCLGLGVTSHNFGTLDTNITARKQRGYLMRQNTKLVAASDKDGDDTRLARSAGNSPVKKDRPQSWTVEPWNGEMRRRSVRKRATPSGPAPPLPGQESNAMALNALPEEDFSAEMAVDEGAERGRLFVKVMGIKDLDLPLPRSACCPNLAFRSALHH